MLDFRSSDRHLALAYATAGASKIATALVQILALPIIARALDVKELGALLAIAAFASIITIFGQGFSATASYTVSFARSQDDPQKVSEAFWSVWALGLAAALIVALTGTAALLMGFEQNFIDETTVIRPHELHMALIAMLLHIVLYYGFWTIEGVRAAYQENYITNSFGLIASIFAFSGCIIASYISPNIASFYFSLFVLPPAAQAINMLLFLRKRRAEIMPVTLKKAAIGKTTIRLLSYSKAQSGITLHLQGAVLLSSHFFGLSAGAVMGGMARLFIQIHSLFLSIIHPVLPTLTRSMAYGRYDELKKRIRLVLIFSIISITLYTALVAVMGDELLYIWLDIKPMKHSNLNIPFALFAFSYSSSHLLYIILLSVDAEAKASWHLLFSGTSACAIGAWWIDDLGLSGLVITNGLILLTICVVPAFLALINILQDTRN